MAVQKGKSDIASKLAKISGEVSKTLAEHKNDVVQFTGMGDCPAGVEGGVAQLVDCKIDQVKEGKTNAGELYFYAAGVVIRPVEYKGQIVEGTRVSLMEMLCETPSRKRKTVREHTKFVMDTLKGLGVAPGAFVENNPSCLLAICQAVKAAKPVFKFRSWAMPKQTSGPFKDKEPMTNYEFLGKMEHLHKDVDPATGVEDDSAQADDIATGSGGTEGEAAFNEFEDLDSLLAQTEDTDESVSDAAIEKLTELALAAGISQKVLDDPDNGWPDVVEMIKNAGNDGEGVAEEPAKPVRKKGDVVKHKVKNVRTKKMVDVECSIEDIKNGKATLKSLVDKTIYKDVDLDVLEDA